MEPEAAFTVTFKADITGDSQTLSLLTESRKTKLLKETLFSELKK